MMFLRGRIFNNVFHCNAAILNWLLTPVPNPIIAVNLTIRHTCETSQSGFRMVTDLSLEVFKPTERQT